MIESFISPVFKPIGEWIGKLILGKFKPKKKEPESIADRFIRLFKSHGIVCDQIPRLIPALSLSDVNSPEKLIEALNDHIVCDACDLFGVEREWLEGAQQEIYQRRSFYKDIRGLNSFLDEQEVTSENWGAFYAVREEGSDIREAEKQQYGVDIVLVFCKLVKQLSSEQVIYRYYPLSDNASWGYLGSRIYFRAVCRLASDRSLMCRGIEVSKVNLEELKNLQAIPQSIIDHQIGSWDVYRIAMTDDEILESKVSCGGDWTDLIQHRDSP